MDFVIKRTGTTVKYNPRKIHAAISGANKDAGSIMTNKDVDAIVFSIHSHLKADQKNARSVEEIQDMVEDALMDAGFNSVAREYIRYRHKHEMRRKASQQLMESYNDLLFADSKDMDLKRDNANINTDAPMGIMLKLGTEGAKVYSDNYVIPDEFVEADHEGVIHLHDKDFSLITWNCMYTDLGKLLKGGFSTGHGHLREPNSIRAAASLACIALQSSQNDMLGGQAINALDFALAPYVDKSYKKAFKKYLVIFARAYHKNGSPCYLGKYCNNVVQIIKHPELDFELTKDLLPSYKQWKKGGYQLYHYFDGKLGDDEAERLWRCAVSEAEISASEEVEEETKQAMEALVHNFNTLHSRAGSQVPFSSTNYGMDTSPEGRLVTDKMLDAIWDGLGNGETPIFPISVFQLKEGINYNPGDPNYDLFKKAIRVSAKRLFPNFISNDSSFNLPYYKEGDYNTFASAMGCRTRVIGNVNGPEITGGRGNFAFVTINLPMLALNAKGDTKKFFKLFDKYIKLSKKYLEHRYSIISHKKAKNFPFILGQHIWMDSEKLDPEDEIAPVLKHASLSIGFCGLAECLVVLTGHHHGESKEAQKLGLEIVGHLREMTDKFTEKESMNWSCFASPAESTAGSFLRATRRKFGIIPGVTDRDYFSNSFHVPPYYPIKAIDKIRIEAPYHSYCNAGAISYIELDGDTLKNLQAFETVVRAMHDHDMGYFSINHPVDRDPVCGYTGVIENECPHCHRKEQSSGELKMARIHV